MKHINLGQTNSILGYFMAQLRDKNIQKDRLRFRKNLERVGDIFAYEVSKTLNYEPMAVETPLGTATVSVHTDRLVIATILRAGLPLHGGMLSFFDDAENAFVAAYRKYDAAEKFHVNTEYCTCPSLTGKVLIIADTMLATGSSIVLAYNRLVEDGGEPSYTHLVCPIASTQAVEYLKKNLPSNVTLWTAAVDEELTSHSYIVPGLGDAGDLAFGGKL